MIKNVIFKNKFKINNKTTYYNLNENIGERIIKKKLKNYNKKKNVIINPIIISNKLENLINQDENNSKNEVKYSKIQSKSLFLESKSCEKPRNYINLEDQNIDDDSKITQLKIKKKIKKGLKLKIDFNFDHLIIRNDDEIDEKEINNIPFRQALRIDKRSFFQIFFSVISNQIGFLKLFFYINPFSHFSLNISLYLFELLLDLTMNCLLYTDDVVSEKYHNDGELTMFTSLSLSLISNIVSSIIVFMISKLTNYIEIVEAILKNVKDKIKYFNNIMRLFKYMKLRLGLYFFLELVFIVVMTYYLFIFCTVYHQSQVSIMINYIIGACISLLTSVGLTLIITLFKFLGIKYKSMQLFNVSKYLYEHF